ncbi:hypothetical protein RCL1_004005 [Eukaryota sp. TZLM3-RCL]
MSFNHSDLTADSMIDPLNVDDDDEESSINLDAPSASFTTVSCLSSSNDFDKSIKYLNLIEENEGLKRQLQVKIKNCVQNFSPNNVSCKNVVQSSSNILSFLSKSISLFLNDSEGISAQLFKKFFENIEQFLFVDSFNLVLNSEISELQNYFISILNLIVHKSEKLLKSVFLLMISLPSLTFLTILEVL